MSTIDFDTDNNIIVLCGKKSSYSIKLYNDSMPLHLHWGAKTSLSASKPFFPAKDRGFTIWAKDKDEIFFVVGMQWEYGFAENGDFRVPAFRVRDGQNYPITGPFELRTHVYLGKTAIP